MHARGYCTKHYQRVMLHGNPYTVLPSGVPTSIEPRFWPRVNKDGPIPSIRPDLGPCWLWTRRLFEGGYGQFSVNGFPIGAHVMAWRLLRGPVPSGLTLDHLCKVRRCVNPHHMEIVTRGENALRGDGPCAINSRKTHCHNGHILSGENLYLYPRTGRRECRTCVRNHHARYAEAS